MARSSPAPTRAGPGPSPPRTCRRSGRSRPRSSAEPASPLSATVHLPRSLVALFPGAPRLVEAEGENVRAVIEDLDRKIPGLRNRLVDAGPVIRTHINVFVAGHRATLDTIVPPGAEVHVIPAVSGG